MNNNGILLERNKNKNGIKFYTIDQNWIKLKSLEKTKLVNLKKFKLNSINLNNRKKLNRVGRELNMK